MKKLLTAISLSLSLALPTSANTIVKKQPTVPAYSLAAMGCMILLECTEGVEKLTVDSTLIKGKEFDAFREEIQKILAGLDKLGVPVYVAPPRYFTPRTVGLYKPEYNRFYVNESLLQDPREFLGTMRHEGWHVVQDCMGGGLKTSFELRCKECSFEFALSMVKLVISPSLSIELPFVVPINPASAASA